jgi:hypothetical protein
VPVDALAVGLEVLIEGDARMRAAERPLSVPLRSSIGAPRQLGPVQCFIMAVASCAPADGGSKRRFRPVLPNNRGYCLRLSINLRKQFAALEYVRSSSKCIRASSKLSLN